MKTTYLLYLTLIFPPGFDLCPPPLLIQTNFAQSKQLQTLNQEIDLSQIRRIASKGRIQDAEYNQLTVVRQLIQRERQAIPYLISKLTDETRLERSTVDLWYKVTVGDVALIILTDFFTDSSWKKTTIPGVGWDEILKRKNKDQTGEEILREFIAKHGRQTIKAKWQKVWNKNKDNLYWDEMEKCFKVRST